MFKNISKEELIIPASMSHLLEVREFIERIGKKYKFSDKIINSFKLVVDETCTNIIRHGYSDIKDGKITIRAIIRRLSLTVVIIDQGKSFDPRQVKDPDLNKYVQIGKKGGLGIFMMRKLMDDIQYNLTSHGNELRLTKMREAVEEPKWKMEIESMSIRRKYFVFPSVALVLLAIVSYFFLVPRMTARAEREIVNEAATITMDFARTNWAPLSIEDDLALFEIANTFHKNRSDLIEYAVVTNSDMEVLAVRPTNFTLAIDRVINLDSLTVVKTIEDVTIYETIINDTSIARMGSEFYYFVSPIQLVTEEISEPEPIGYAMLWIDHNIIDKAQASTHRRWLMLILGILIFGLIGIAILVTRITEPFHKLAEWVRQVGRGQVDEDEIDIDARDEIGEIAQAFSEVTSKFREAQVTVIEQQRLQKELQVAQEIQQMLLPDDFPDVVGYDIASYYQSAKEVGGDLFDFMEVDDQSIGVCVADVSGKGIPGSLVMTMIRTSLRLETRGNKNPAQIVTKVNNFVTDDIRKGMFVTMLYVILDSRERTISFSSAGHNPMILYRGKSKETFYLNPSGFPVGITLPDIALFGERIQHDKIRLHPDDIFVLYTDGITEAMNPQRELYGEERFLAAIRKFGHLDVVEFVKSIKDDILTFTGGFEQNDDITLVAIKENMAAVDVKVNMFRHLFEQVQTNSKLTIAEACKEAGISPTTFYRYKRIYQEGGYDLLREMLHGYTNLGLRHMSIEVKTKMYDIIRKYPEYGPKKISDELNSETYAFTEVSPTLIYEELKRAKLNTKERRTVFVHRGGKKRLKPPGTPLLTLDGDVLVGFRSEDQQNHIPYIPPAAASSRPKEKILAAKGRNIPAPPPETSETSENSVPVEEPEVDNNIENGRSVAESKNEQG